MSNRSLIEINHDFCDRLGEEALKALRRYLNSANRETADALQQFGIKVVGMRHHSGTFVLDGTPDGFPAIHLPAALQPQEPGRG
jgi:hypothetical protein